MKFNWPFSGRDPEVKLIACKINPAVGFLEFPFPVDAKIVNAIWWNGQVAFSLQYRVPKRGASVVVENRHYSLLNAPPQNPKPIRDLDQYLWPVAGLPECWIVRIDRWAP